MRVTVAWTVVLMGMGGCYSHQTGFESAVPSERLEAITEAARTNDRSAIPDLISMLQSDDPVVRMMSIRTLQRMTGTTLGYDYAAPEWERRDRVRAWAEWYRQQAPSPASPAGTPGAGGRAENSASGPPKMPISGEDA